MVSSNIGCVRIVPLDDELEVRFEYNESHGGLPFRTFNDPATGSPALLSKSAFRLSPGEWGRLRWNGRFSHEEGWWYEDHCINVGLFIEEPTPVVFKSPPSQHYEDLAKLW